MRMTRKCVVTVLVGALGAAGLVSCGADDSGDGEGTGLTAALSGVPASQAEQAITYRDVSAARRLVAADKSLYRGLDGYGIIEFMQGAHTARPRSYGFEAKDVTASVLLSNGYSQRLTGTFDVDAVRKAMRKRGYTATEGDDGAVRLRKKGQADIEVSADARTSQYVDGVKLPLDPPDRSVTDDPAYKAVVSCLGDDVYEASLYGKNPGYRKQGITLLGIGGHADDAAHPTEKLCARTTSEDAAEKVAAELRAKTAPGERFTGAKVNVGDGDTPVVSIIWKNSTKPGMRPTDQDRTGELPMALLRP
ncbi:hypothetical protein [Streptomyces sp. NPDC052225]|uniref:hypothetical protein n=1 Tax=Streptomyces sp. NPDC052225 TaxID=3154949 RepID=UPI0034281CA0